MKSFRDLPFAIRTGVLTAVIVLVTVLFAVAAKGSLPDWIANIESASALERILFRSVPMPHADPLYRRPPSETVPALGELIQQHPSDAELYSLRAMEDEQNLDFTAAESDWTQYVAKSQAKTSALFALADFYHRRLRPRDEIVTLSKIATAPASPSERFTPVTEQFPWLAFERIFTVIHEQGFAHDVSIANYRAWLARYPAETSIYSRYLEFLIAQKDYSAANDVIAAYAKQFPSDEAFRVKAEALLDYRRGSAQEGLAVYEKSFQPLWDPDLVKSYFDLLTQTQSMRKFLDESRAALAANPEDLRATARVFYYYQQQGKLDAAEQAIADLRHHKEAANSTWTPDDLYVCGRLLEQIHSYPEAARYYFALYSSKGAADTQQRSLARLTNILLSAPEAPIRLGAGDLSMYKDIVTLDQGPGYFNGILSLILNTTNPSSEYFSEQQRAVPYFHRARAAELLAMLDKNFPAAPDRPELHEKLLQFYAASAQSDAVLKSGASFLADFPRAPQRTAVALLMADADARLNKNQDEFAIYDSILKELAAASDNMPLGPNAAYAQGLAQTPVNDAQQPAPEVAGEPVPEGQNSGFELVATPSPALPNGPRSEEYSRVLDRYLARLVELHRIPDALGVLRREIDRNSDDPGLYERLAVFLDQNNITSEQEEVYRRAMARFPDRSWYAKLARFYLRRRRTADFESLTEEAVKQFNGSGLQTYFESVVNGGSETLYVRLNQYANARFPHNPYFIRNLLNAYRQPKTQNLAAWEVLLRQHWFEESDLRNEFFEFLSSNNKLESEIAALDPPAPSNATSDWSGYVRTNPAAVEFVAQSALWRSHYEESASALAALAAAYPADLDRGRTASSVFRSLAYFDSADTAIAVKIEKNLLAADPTSSEILARIGDIYSDRELFAEAAFYWDRIPQIAPGQSGSYLEAATIYWDYYDFDNALRLLNDGRKHLANPTLYGYEEGAIYESKHDDSAAIREYTAVALANGESAALERLLALARRPQLRDQIDHYTQQLQATTGYSAQYVKLRIRVLETQNRKSEIATFLNDAVDRSGSLERLAELETLAQQQSIEEVRRRALEKQADIAADPVTRLQLRFALVQLLENTDPSEARRQIEKIYRSNNKILGVVRAMVDFYWRAKLYPESIAVLEQAAKDSYPSLSRRFTFEAAAKCIEAQRYQQARNLLAPLVKESPYDAQYLGVIADSYAREGDQQDLKKFYLDEIAAFRNAPLSSDDRKSRVAAMRRALIPALTTLKDYSGAIDQYIEVINAFPADEALVAEAANYALRREQRAKLLDSYVHTAQQSPRDDRWPVVVARINIAFEDYPAAIDAYGKAIAIRPDRTDLRMARATLNERLLQFDAAIADYEKLYQLTYKDPQWMIDVAEDRARQGRNSDAVTALHTAIVDPAPDRPENYFNVAGRLEIWGILDAARSYAEKGVSAAGPDFLASPQYHDDARIYARVMTRLRLQQQAWSTLQQSRTAASSQLPVVKEQVAHEGIAAISNQQWRDNTLAVRRANADSGMRAAANEMGMAVALYFTPEEKVSFAEFVRKIRATCGPADVEQIVIPLLQNGGLAEEEANTRVAILMNTRLDRPTRDRQKVPLIELQTQRLQFAALAKQLEDYAATQPSTERIASLLSAADAYHAQGDAANELRVFTAIAPMRITGEARSRYFRLLLDKQPAQLLKLSGLWTDVGQSAADFAIANAGSPFVQQVVAIRSAQRLPVWKSAYASLVGLYFAEKSPAINASFLGALGDQTIAERIGKPVDRDKQLAGDIWFYYGSRYGEYLADLAEPNGNDFLPSSLEQSPATASSYLSLADFYFEKGDTAAAIDDYKHFLELSPSNAAVHDRLAVAYYKQGHREAALDEWRLFFFKVLAGENAGRVPETFWSDFGKACDHLAERKLFSEVKPQAAEVVRTYLRHNGNFRSNAVLQSVYAADKDRADAIAWILDLSNSAPDPIAVLGDIVDAKWIPFADRAPIYRHILDAKRNAVANLQGGQHDVALGDLHAWQVRWVRYLITSKQFIEAGAFLSSMPPVDPADPTAAEWIPLELRVDTLDTKLAAYRADPDAAPAPELLRTAATEIAAAGDNASAQKILEFVYTRELDRRQLLSANFLGLAEIRLNSGDTASAVQLLRRMILVAGNPYGDLDSAAALLEKTGYNAETIPFLESLANSTPWEPAFRIRLAKAQFATAATANAQTALTKVAGTQSAPYQRRVEAAWLLSGASHSADLGSAELNLLAADPNRQTPAAADQPFFYQARLRAVQNSSAAAQKLHLLADAVSDTPASDQARIPLFYAAASLHQDDFALASVANVQRGQLAAQSSRRVRVADEDEPTDVTDSQPSENSSSTSADRPPRLTAQQRAQFVFAVAQAMIRIDRLTEAQPYLQSALHFETNAGRRKEITATLADVRARVRRAENNLARQPILHAELEQDRIVRPRLVARPAARKTATSN